MILRKGIPYRFPMGRSYPNGPPGVDAGVGRLIMPRFRAHMFMQATHDPRIDRTPWIRSTAEFLFLPKRRLVNCPSRSVLISGNCSMSAEIVTLRSKASGYRHKSQYICPYSWVFSVKKFHLRRMLNELNCMTIFYYSGCCTSETCRFSHLFTTMKSMPGDIVHGTQ